MRGLQRLGEWLNSREIRGLIEAIKSQWGGCPELDFLFLKKRDGRIYLVARDISNFESEGLFVSSIGLYFARETHGELRLSIEGSQIVGPHAKRNVLELTEPQFRLWITGQEPEIKEERQGFQIISHSGDFYGCGRLVQGKLLNLVPKERRIMTLGAI